MRCKGKPDTDVERESTRTSEHTPAAVWGGFVAEGVAFQLSAVALPGSRDRSSPFCFVGIRDPLRMCFQGEQQGRGGEGKGHCSCHTSAYHSVNLVLMLRVGTRRQWDLTGRTVSDSGARCNWVPVQDVPSVKCVGLTCHLTSLNLVPCP